MKNLAIRVEPTEVPDTFVVLGRGELQLAILVETMRREGYEMQLSNPEVVTREIDGEMMEPLEARGRGRAGHLRRHRDSSASARRRGRMVKMTNPGFGRARLEFRVPSRGLIGFRGEFLDGDARDGPAQHDVRRLGALERPDDAPPDRRHRRRSRRRGDRTRCTTCSRAGMFFIVPGVEVYEGMIIGEHNRPTTPTSTSSREKKLSNVRNHGKDENVLLRRPRRHDRDGDGVDRRRRARRGHARRGARPQEGARVQPPGAPRGRDRAIAGGGVSGGGRGRAGRPTRAPCRACRAIGCPDENDAALRFPGFARRALGGGRLRRGRRRRRLPGAPTAPGALARP